jgi:hypothetical protein
MFMFRFGLSNLQLRSNLLPEDYQGEYKHRSGKKVAVCITAFEVKDIKRRNPLLNLELTSEQHEALIESLFWGDTAVTMADNDRHEAWLEQLARNVEEAIVCLEASADVERAFEVLCVAESLAALPGSIYGVMTDAARQIRSILKRPEFKLSSEMINDRLTEILGHDRRRRTSSPPLAAPPAVPQPVA